MADLMLKHLTEDAGGWLVTIARSKTDPTGRGATLRLDHDREHGDACDPLCGACALEALLAIHQRQHGRAMRDAALVFPAELGTNRRWSTKAASKRLRRWWLAAGLDADARISSRGIRAGTAT